MKKLIAVAIVSCSLCACRGTQAGSVAQAETIAPTAVPTATIAPTPVPTITTVPKDAPTPSPIPSITPTPIFHIAHTLNPEDFIAEVNRIFDPAKMYEGETDERIAYMLWGPNVTAELPYKAIAQIPDILQTSTWEPESMWIMPGEERQSFQTAYPFIDKMDPMYHLIRDMRNAPDGYIQSEADFYLGGDNVEVWIDMPLGQGEYYYDWTHKIEYCRFVLPPETSQKIEKAFNELIEKYGEQ